MDADPPDSRPSRRRARCHSVETRTSRDSRCMVRVEVEWISGEIVEGQGQATDTPEGRMQAGATAALEAVSRVGEGAIGLEIRGTKLVRAFDGLIVIAALRALRGEHRYDLIGSTVAPRDDVARGAVLTVLDATNWILEPRAPVEAAGDPNVPETSLE